VLLHFLRNLITIANNKQYASIQAARHTYDTRHTILDVKYLELGAHAVSAAHEQGIPVAGLLQIEQTAKSACHTLTRQNTTHTEHTIDTHLTRTHATRITGMYVAG
jgi:hypothetical protein